MAQIKMQGGIWLYSSGIGAAGFQRIDVYDINGHKMKAQRTLFQMHSENTPELGAKPSECEEDEHREMNN